MKTLRAKIALLLVGSMVTIVALITLTMVTAFRTPTEALVEMLARQLIQMEQLAQTNPLGEELAHHPHAGVPDEQQTELLRTATARLGTPLDLAVTYDDADSRVRTASLRVAPERWLLIDFDPPADPELWAWFILITIAVGSIALFAAHRMSRPLALLERAAESVHPDGSLPELAEQGPTEVRATAIAINTLSHRLKRAIESRMRLLAAAGHDLRTPLTRMRLRAEFVTDDEDRASWLNDIDELERIAESTIQFVRDETAPASPELIRVDELVRAVVAELREQDFRVQVAQTDEVSIHASRLALTRALRNLLINAATHGISAVASVMGGATARVTIVDVGPGIDDEVLDQVFEPFFRADRARRQNIPGAGLGLSISREIVRKDGGDIRISNRPGGGLVQVVEFPSAPPPRRPGR
ncbi:ATP-binding protein [Acuticoccus kandeliae]|uniref:ATP-binding protein n=1 Tax=Acuticoccus kandeliae TaxID=2073160 RepID=UPI000D3EDCA4|nr:ATP-binding protein [Acuticoccus kandeliae]